MEQKKNNINIMTDIETLGKDVDTTVFQIAAAAFDLKTGEIIKTFNVIADISKSYLHASGDTIKWWLETDAELFKKLLSSGTISEREMFQQFHDWIPDTNENDVCLWGNGILFDNNIIRAHMDRYGYDYPIKYNMDRDQRTIVALAADKLGISVREVREKFLLSDCHDHDAMDDVRKQVYLVSQCYQVVMN